jgi:hypothetical protein
MEKQIQQGNRPKNLSSSIAVKARINKCVRIIYETHVFLSGNGLTIPRYLKNRAVTLITKAENELNNLILK